MASVMSGHDVTPVFPILQIEDGAQNVSVNAGRWVKDCLAGLKQGLEVLTERLRGVTNADTTNNTLAPQRHSTSDGSNNTRIDIGNIIAASPGTDPSNALQPQSTSDNDALNNSLNRNSMLSKIFCAGSIMVIVGTVFVQISKPKYPYRWTAIAELAVQSIALGAMMMGFYVGPTNYVLAAIWSHRIGHMFFLEGIALAGVCRFHGSPRFIPLVLLPVPAVLIPIYVFI